MAELACSAEREMKLQRQLAESQADAIRARQANEELQAQLEAQRAGQDERLEKQIEADRASALDEARREVHAQHEAQLQAVS